MTHWLTNAGCSRLLSRLLKGVSVIALLASSSVFAAGETLEIRNTSPLAQLFGLPAMRGARAESPDLRFSIDVANSFTGDFNADEFVFLDGETAVLSYTARRPLASRWEAGLEFAWVVHSGGRFDGLIDEFHDLFGLPDGGRPLADRGALDYVVRTDGQVRAEVRDKVSDLGDVRGWLGLSLIDSPARSLMARAHLKLPTGDAGQLSGSGGFDVALALDYVDSQLLQTLGVQVSVGAGLMIPGDADLLARRQKSLVPFGHLGLGVKLGKRARLLGQLDAHGPLFDARLSHLGHAVLQGTLGVQYSFGTSADLQLSIIEDLSGAMASDVIFKLAVTGRL